MENLNMIVTEILDALKTVQFKEQTRDVIQLADDVIPDGHQSEVDIPKFIKDYSAKLDKMTELDPTIVRLPK